MPSTLLYRRYDEAVAKAEWLDKMAAIAATQDLSEDLRGDARALTIAFTVLATIVVGMRFLARRRQGAAILIDDWLIVFSLALLYGNCAMNMVLIHQGVGLHTGALTVDQLAVMNETLVGAEIIYCTGVNMYKIALLYLYFRIFPMRDIRRGAYICGGISMMWNVACIFAATFQCLPREKIWHPWVQGGCIDLFLTQLAISVPCILLDISILCLPLPHVWRLKTNTTQKVALTLIFMLGSYVVFTSIYRFVVFLGYRNEDNSYTLGHGIAWNVIEISSGIVSACLPTLGPLVRLVFTSLYPSSLASRASKNKLSGAYASHKASNKRSTALVTIGGGGGGASAAKRSQNREDNKYGFMPDDDSERGIPVASSQGEVNVSAASTNGHTKNYSSDEIPLTGVRQEIRFEWTEERVPTPPKV